jgi:hypothetical protein
MPFFLSKSSSNQTKQVRYVSKNVQLDTGLGAVWVHISTGKSD